MLLKDNDVVFTQIEDSGIAENVHIRGRRVLQDVLLGVAHGLARPENIQLGLPHAVHCAVAVEEILGDGETVSPIGGVGSQRCQLAAGGHGGRGGGGARGGLI